MSEPAPLADTPAAFLGRAGELESLAAWWQGGGGLLTITGPPGAGKSRLARRFVAGLEVPAAWVDLSGVRAAHALGEQVARALDVPLEGVTSPDEAVARIGAALSARGPLILVLDDADGAVEALAAAASTWRGVAPQAALLVTSRERLRLPIERPLEIGGLDPEAAAELFLRRAAALGPELEHDPVVERIAERLDHLPLALELAAVRTAVLEPRELLGRLDGVLGVLTRSFRGPAGEGPSLRAAIEASWALLGQRDRSFLARIAVFRGSFTLEAAEAVVDLGGDSVLDAVQSLREHSLLRAVDAGRYRPFTGVGERAAEALTDPQRQAVRRRHLAWAAGLDEAGVDDLRAEVANLEAALEHWDGAPEGRGDAARVALALGRVREVDGVVRARLAAYDWVGAAPGRVGARLAAARAEALRLLGRREAAVEALEEADGILGDDEAPGVRADIGLERALLAFRRGDLEVMQEGFAQADRAARRAGDPVRQARATTYRGMFLQYRGDLETARRVLEAAVRQAEAAGDIAVIEFAWSAQARLYTWMGLADRATTLLRRLVEREGASSRRTRLHAGVNLAHLYMDRCQHDQAEALLHEVRDEAQRCGLVGVISSAWNSLGALAWDRGRLPEALEAWDRAEALAARHGPPARVYSVAMHRGAALAGAGRRDEAREVLGRVLGEGREAVSQPVLAGVHALAGELDARAGDAAGAQAHFEQARALSQRVPGPIDHWVSLERGFLDHLLAETAGDPEQARVHRERLWDRLQRVLAPGVGGRAPAEQSIEVRGATRRLLASLEPAERAEAWAGGLDPEAAALVVDAERHRFRLPGGEWVELEGRDLLERMVGCLVERARQGDGSVTGDELVEAGWPDEKMLYESARNRLHKNLWVIRKLGFKPLLETTADGWRLDPALRIVDVPGTLCLGGGRK